MNKLNVTAAVFLTFATSVAFARPPHFQEFDSNNDGSVTRAEVESNAASQAQEFDANGDGNITLEEMQAAHERRRQEHMQKRLNEADTNGDGVVGPDEFSSQMVEQVMRRDSNGDGVINKDDRPARNGKKRHQHPAQK
ncbi:MAG: EF-hand domain-containing protein [Oceanococcus sp.]